MAISCSSLVFSRGTQLPAHRLELALSTWSSGLRGSPQVQKFGSRGAMAPLPCCEEPCGLGCVALHTGSGLQGSAGPILVCRAGCKLMWGVPGPGPSTWRQISWTLQIMVVCKHKGLG